jgi:hypothetical protein
VNKNFFSLFLGLLFSYVLLNAPASSGKSFYRLYSLPKKTVYLAIDEKAPGNELEVYDIEGANSAENNRFPKILGNLVSGYNNVNERSDLLCTNTSSFSSVPAKEYLFNIYPSHNFW